MSDMLVYRCMKRVVAMVASTRTSIATSKSGRQRTFCGFRRDGDGGKLEDGSAGGAVTGLNAGRALGKIGKMVAGGQSNGSWGQISSLKNTPEGIRYGSVRVPPAG